MISKGQTKRSPARIDLEGRVSDRQTSTDTIPCMLTSHRLTSIQQKQAAVAPQMIHHRKTSFCVSFRPIVCLYPLPDLSLPGLPACLLVPSFACLLACLMPVVPMLSAHDEGVKTKAA